jgi:hypothetical protein
MGDRMLMELETWVGEGKARKRVTHPKMKVVPGLCVAITGMDDLPVARIVFFTDPTAVFAGSPGTVDKCKPKVQNKGKYKRGKGNGRGAVLGGQRKGHKERRG